MWLLCFIRWYNTWTRNVSSPLCHVLIMTWDAMARYSLVLFPRLFDFAAVFSFEEQGWSAGLPLMWRCGAVFQPCATCICGLSLLLHVSRLALRVFSGFFSFTTSRKPALHSTTNCVFFLLNISLWTYIQALFGRIFAFKFSRSNCFVLIGREKGSWKTYSGSDHSSPEPCLQENRPA